MLCIFYAANFCRIVCPLSGLKELHNCLLECQHLYIYSEFFSATDVILSLYRRMYNMCDAVCVIASDNGFRDCDAEPLSVGIEVSVSLRYYNLAGNQF